MLDKINLALLDKDKDYLNSFVEYVASTKSQKLQVIAFTEYKYLLNYLSEGQKQVDVLLVSRDFYKDVSSNCSGVIILLDDGKAEVCTRYKNIINKYQYGDKLTAEIMSIFSKNTVANYNFDFDEKKTKIIGVYSPAGGTGTTTVAVGASIQLAWEGKDVFYLNLENMPSTPLYFTGDQNDNLSTILYFIKSKAKNLTIKLDGAKCVDPLYKIHYFLPPDSIYDFNEDVSKEIITLLRELKGTNQYDKIIVDMSCEINKNNLAVLKYCDEIILVLEQDKTSEIKLQCMLKELRLLSPKNNCEIIEKFHLVVNKYSADTMWDEGKLKISEKELLIKIPWVENLTTFKEGLCRLDMNSEFGKAIYQMLLNIK